MAVVEFKPITLQKKDVDLLFTIFEICHIKDYERLAFNLGVLKERINQKQLSQED